MTRHRIMIQKWKFDEDSQDSASKNNDEISAPLEHLEELQKSDYKIADHLSKIYGWPVVGKMAEKMGALKDFLFDRNEERIRYLLVNLENEERVKEDKVILIPIGRAVLDPQEKRIVVLENLTSKDLSEIPAYKNVKSLAIEDEKHTLSIFSSEKKQEIAYTKQYFYNQDEFNEGVFFGSDEK